ncbi:MAG TPA: M55 family metallopeptidase [Micromonosporaceae bacterium]|nr:M55 family metallopeptidase [Micromonosporaceae bacterium]
MRVFISIDMEGVAGVATLDQILRGGSGYPRAQELMTAEANAAIRGASAGGATDILVNDSHGTMDNLLADRLDRRARLLLGAPKASCMAQGVRVGDACAVFIGYHAAAGTTGVLAHSFSVGFTEVRLNGVPVSEAEVNGVYVGSRGVPVAALSGDDHICKVARNAFPGVAAIEVKTSVSFAAADALAPAEACERIEEAVAAAVAGSAELPRPVTPERLALEVDFATPLAADLAGGVPGSRRTGGRTLARDAADVDELMSTVMAWYHLGGLAAQQIAAITTRR